MAERLKDMFFTDSSLNQLADAVHQVFPEFDRQGFLGRVRDNDWEKKELKERMRHTTLCLAEELPGDYERALDILMEAAPAVKGFEAMAFPDYVGLYGTEDWDRSLAAIKYFTGFASGEWAIRVFLMEDLDRALERMSKWAEDESEQVRRLASEGCRPRLPWAPALPQLKKDPRPILPILEKLKDDESEFVRRSVANNLNDISKDNPEIALEVCKRWLGRSKNTDWIVKHACRTLLKAGDKRALALFGYADPSRLKVSDVRCDPPKVGIGEEVEFGFSLSVPGDRACRVRVEYAVFFVKARGRRTKKVFKISESEQEPGVRQFTRRHSFADQSTRKHYPGEHEIAVIVNGEEKARFSLDVKA